MATAVHHTRPDVFRERACAVKQKPLFLLHVSIQMQHASGYQKWLMLWALHQHTSANNHPFLSWENYRMHKPQRTDPPTCFWDSPTFCSAVTLNCGEMYGCMCNGDLCHTDEQGNWLLPGSKPYLEKFKATSIRATVTFALAISYLHCQLPSPR